MNLRRADTGLPVALGARIAGGGEGTIYEVAPAADQCAKIYHADRRTPERRDKLAAMLAHPPADPAAAQRHRSIAWPEALLEDGGAFAGFLLPRAPRGARTALQYLQPEMRQAYAPGFHFRYLLTCARNLASAVGALHQAGYRVGDLNESNCMITPTALVTIIDCDSFQVPAGGGRWLPCAVGKPEYTAPELAGRPLAGTPRTAASDAFALAVLIFQLLMQGYHPFTGRWSGAGDPPPVTQRIAEGMYAYGGGTWPFRPPRAAPPLEVLPGRVRDAFRRAFGEGVRAPARRPSPGDWVRCLQQGAEQLAVCLANTQHLYPRGLRACPWCALAARGAEYFPEVLGAQTALPPPGALQPVATRAAAPAAARQGGPSPGPAASGTTGPPVLLVEPEDLSFRGVARGGAPPAQQIVVRNVGKGVFDGRVEVVPPGDHLAVQPAALRLSPFHGENTATVSVRVHAARLQWGRRYTSLLRVTGNVAAPRLVRVAVVMAESGDVGRAAGAYARAGVWASVGVAAGASQVIGRAAGVAAGAVVDRTAGALLHPAVPGAVALAAWLLASAWMVRRHVPMWRKSTWDPWREAVAGVAATTAVLVLPPLAADLVWRSMLHPSAPAVAAALTAAWGGLAFLVARGAGAVTRPLIRLLANRRGMGPVTALIVTATLGLGAPAAVAGMALAVPAIIAHARVIAAPPHGRTHRYSTPPAPRRG